MKRYTFFQSLLFTLGLVFISGCLVKSFNPFYELSDVTFDERLIGSWQDQDESNWIFEKYQVKESILDNNKIHPHYVLRYVEDEDKISRFMVTLFEIGNDLYLDFYPDMETVSGHDFFTLHTMPVHSLAKIDISSKEDVRIKWFNEEWMFELIESQKTDLDHELIYQDSDDATLILTAPTKDLKEFIYD